MTPGPVARDRAAFGGTATTAGRTVRAVVVLGIDDMATRARGTARLRAATGALHAEVEDRTGLPGTLRTPDDVVGLLTRWSRLADRLEPRAAHGTPSLHPALAADLAALGRTVAPPTPLPAAEEGPHALGVTWVLLGARLGLRTLHEHTRALVGFDLATCAGTDPTRLRVCRAELDGEPGVCCEGIPAEDATLAFQQAAATLGGPPWS